MARPTATPCPRCGSVARSSTARFCARCGQALTAAPSAVPPPVQPMAAPPPVVQFPPPAYPPMAFSTPQHAPFPHPLKNPPPKAKKSGCGCLTAILVVVGLLLLIGYGSQRSSRTSDPAKSLASPTVLPSYTIPTYDPKVGYPAKFYGARLGDVQLTKSSSTTRYQSTEFAVTVDPDTQKSLKVAAYLVDGYGSLVQQYPEGDRGRSVSAVARTINYSAMATMPLSPAHVTIPIQYRVPPYSYSPSGSTQYVVHIVLFDQSDRVLDRSVRSLRSSN